MSDDREYTSNTLTLRVVDRADAIEVSWLGRSSDRDPGKFLDPILTPLLAAVAGGKAIVMDFCKLAYMNSSTVAPLIRLLDTAKRGTQRITILYDKSAKWQELSFVALKAFTTKDGRIRVVPA
jgi:hypothetical protein